MDIAHRWTLVGLCTMAVVLVAQDRLSLGFLNGSDSQDRQEQTQRMHGLMLDREFEVQVGGALRVDVGDGDVEVRSSPAGAAGVKVFVQARDLDWGREVFERMRFEVREEGGGLLVRSHDPRIRDHEWRDNRGVGIKVEITVPREFDLDIHTSDGDVDIGASNGRVDLRTSDGDVAVGALRGPEISIHTSDGDVLAESLESDRILVETSDGDVDLSVRGGSAHIRTSDGDIRLNLLAQGEIELRTGDGDITVYTDPSLQADLELHGDVRMESEIQLVGRIDRNFARGKLNGGGPLLLARTGDGTITIREGRR